MMERPASQQPEDFINEMTHETYTQRETRSKSKEKVKDSKYIPPFKVGPPTKKIPEPKKVKFAEPLAETKDPDEGSGAVREEPDMGIAPSGPVINTTHPVKDDTSARFSPVTYRSQAPVELGLDIEKLVETVLDLEINIPLRNLAGVSGAIQKEIRKQVTKTRQPIELATRDNIPKAKQFVRLENIPITIGTFSQQITEEHPEGCIVANDPVLQYLAEHAEVQPSEILVSSISEPLKAIYTTINRVGQEECLIDNGSMIISMGREVAVQLGLTWDPTIRINMESASNHVEKTLGLARNINFGVGGLNLLLQVHILEAPPYRVLLGRPFDVYTSSIVQTKPDGTSELVLTDPNTKRIAIVPTYERGVGPEELQKQKYQSF